MKAFLTLVAMLTSLIIPFAQADTSAPVDKVVYHVNDAANATAALRNINNHLNADANAKIVVVTHSKGINFLLNDAMDEKGEAYQPKVAGLKNRGVDFRVCANTLKGRKLDQSAVIFEASIVPSGVAEIAKLQAREGFVYVKP
jgi:intracellular sulfur oxidation DsrE/DsrF family protein